MHSTSWRRTVRIVLADLCLLISFLMARSKVNRAVAAERKKAKENFRELKRLQELEIR